MAWYGIYSVEETETHVRDAREALARDDLQQAFFHVVAALTTDPLQAEWRLILDEVIRRAGDAEAVLQPDGDPALELVAAAQRAYVCASNRDFKVAIPLLASAAQRHPEAPLLLWASEWVRVDAAAAELDPPQILDIMKATLPWVGLVPSPARVDDPRRRNLEAMSEVLAAVRNAASGDALVLYASACVLRRLARFDEAIELAHHAWQIDPSWSTTIGVACALRDSKRVDEAASWYMRALALKPGETSALLDMGDMLLDAERHDEAMAAYAQVLQRSPQDPWAEPSLLYTRWKKDSQPEDEELLRQLAPTSDRARELLGRLEPVRAFVDHLPKPGGPAISALVKLADELERDPSRAHGGSVAVDLLYLESPSVLTAFRLWTAARGWSVDVTFNVERVQQPDPRAPKGHVDFALWAYDGGAPRPLLAPPDTRVLAPLAAIAKRPFDLGDWQNQAREVAAQMGTAWIPQLACAIVHPPPLRSPKENPFSWVLRCQIATALVVGSMQPDEPWMLSTRRRALHTLALGPTDWSTDATIVVLAWTAIKDPEARDDVESLFNYLENVIPAEGFTSWERTLCEAWLSIGNHDDPTRQRLTDWRRRLDQTR